MDNTDIISSWKKADEYFQNISPIKKTDIEKSLLQKTKRSSLGLKISIYTNLIVQCSIIPLSLINIYIYNSNTTIIIISLCFLLIVIPFIIYSLNKIKSLRIIERNDQNILETLNNKISFCRSMGFLWPLFTAISYEFLVMLINMIIDADNGSYKINNPGIFILISLVFFLFIFFVNLFSNLTYIKGFQLQIRELTEKKSDERFRKIKSIIMIIGIIILSGFLILGIYMFLK